MRRLLLWSAVSCIVAFTFALPAEGETIINLPPDRAPRSGGFDEVLNVLDGGDLPSHRYVPFQAGDGSTVNITGGTVGDFFTALPGSMVNIFGGEFQFDGQLLPGLDKVGDQMPINIPSGSTVAGVLSDGSVFGFGSLGRDSFADGTLTLIRGPDLAPAAAVINLPSDPAPQGLRGGQTLNLREGGRISDLSALAGSVVNVMGGSMWDFRDNGGSTVNISSGIVDSFGANIRSTVNISGGSIGPHFDALSGSMVHISGGSVGYNFDAKSGSTVHISGGTVGLSFEAFSGATVHLIGQEFHLDGQRVPGLDQEGDQVPLNVPDGSVVAGVLSDGSVIAFGAFDRDVIADGTLTLVRAADLPPAPPVINVPADPAPQGVRGGQTLNLHEGGQLNDEFITLAGSVVNIMAGTVGSDFVANGGATVNISGGTVGESFRANRGSTVNISGGTFGRDFDAFSGSMVRISGEELQIDGQLVPGLNEVGDRVTVNVPDGSVVAGLLSDGTAFAFGPINYVHDSFADGTLTLVRGADLPPAPAVINVPSDPVPQGLRRGQTLNLHEGGQFDEITMLAGSVVNIMGGEVHRTLNVAAGSLANISGGTVRYLSTFDGSTTNISGGAVDFLFAGAGSTVNISGGTVDEESIAGPGSTVNISGGTVGGDFEVLSGATVNVSGGTAWEFDALEGSTVNVSGGMAWELRAESGSTVNITGGVMGRYLYVDSGSTMNLSGSEFQIDGQMVPGLENPGDRVSVKLDSGSVLGGVLADGSVFALRDIGRRDRDTVGEVTLLRAADLSPAVAVVNVPSDPAPHGLRTGQTLNLRDGGQLGRGFTALGGNLLNISGGTVESYLAVFRSTVNISGGTVEYGFFAADRSTVNITGGTVGDYAGARDSTVNIFGGTVGKYFSAGSGATVNIFDGTVGSRFQASDGSTVNIYGGTVGEDFSAIRGSTVNISGGTVGDDLRVSDGATLNISGGTLEYFRAEGGSTVNISGGTLESLWARSESTVNISGGMLLDIRASGGSTVNLFGTEFLLSGLPIAGLDEVGDSVILSERDGTVLGVTLRDGGQRDFVLDTSCCRTDRFATDATLRLTLAHAIPEPSSLLLLVMAALGLSLGRRRRRRPA